MRVLGICGSPRHGGNSELLLNAALEPLREAGWDACRILLSEARIGPCLGCDACALSGECAVTDDMQQLYAEFASCDALIIATPVYYRNVTAQLKAVFDRSYAGRGTRPLLGKAGGAIAVGRGSGGGQSTALTVIYNYFLSSGAICVPGELNGVSAVADKPGDILAQPDRLWQARVLGENVARYAAMLSSSPVAGS